MTALPPTTPPTAPPWADGRTLPPFYKVGPPTTEATASLIPDLSTVGPPIHIDQSVRIGAIALLILFVFCLVFVARD